MKREINFRLGKGRRTEQQKALTAKSLIATMKHMGMSDEQIKIKLMEMLRPKGR